MAQVKVSKAYVREQLQAMGVRDLTEQELEEYTRDFTRLIEEHLQHDTSASLSSGDSFTTNTTTSTLTPSLSPQQDTSTEESTVEATPHTHQHTRYAVFKTFPGEKENLVYSLPASTTASPIRPSHIQYSNTHTPSPTPPPLGNSGNAVVRRKRKTLRKVNGVSRVFEESYSTDGSLSVSSMSSDLSSLSLSSDDSDSPAPERPQPRKSGGVQSTTTTTAAGRPQCKSFIRPSTCQLNSRRQKWHDPVSRYHEWKQIWENERVPPGEDSRKGLRWRIREQMTQQDLPFFVRPQKPIRHNHYIVPTDKKRQTLRWEVRHRMAQQ